MRSVVDITGRRFTRLTVIKRVENAKCGKLRWLCKCDCGNFIAVMGCSLKSGVTKSCGCLHKEVVRTHGMSNNPLCQIWVDMKNRCNSPQNPAYKNYGGRNIKVCKRWYKFENFLEDMGPRPKGLTLERIDNDGGYEPENCKWATCTEQNTNTRLTKKFKAISPMGEEYTSKTQRGFARKHGLDQANIWRCLNNRQPTHKGWSLELICRG